MGYISIIRPINCLITFVSVLCGAWVGKKIFFDDKIFLAGITGFLVCAFGNIVNDLLDIEIDQINNPKRPLVAKKIKRNGAIIMATLMAIAAVVSSISLGLNPFLLVIIAIFLLFFYSYYFKKTPFANFIVAIIAGLSFIFGGFITDNIISVVPALFAILIHTPREIIKDIIDIKGDQKFGVKSLPIIYGEKRAHQIAIGLILLLICVAPVPYFFKILNTGYLLIIIFGALPLLIYTIVNIRNNNLASKLLKLIMVVGLIAFIAG
ncbi:MAG: geranylgeranylglycerol-phosphate geranylgeranyltransferase [candidate division WOR-3 bacterium]|nr:geranylgeranylglycerol-phosphate geranylgeranyltransferase [candidate division WOR-3 bacterium]